MEIGLHNGMVDLAPYSPRWAEAFQTERAILQAALGDAVLDIQHVGSTAVPGLTAKPILDIAVAVESYEAGHALVDRLAELGYTHLGERGRPRRHFFTKGAGNVVTHHLYMLEVGGEDWSGQLRFRDALRADPLLARRYGDLKHRLADRHALDREAYRLAKGGFIIEVLRRVAP
jgi:GrpB-like predicted nucleotidyltransferase (UPF0157 family)